MSDPKTEFLNKARPLAQNLINYAMTTANPGTVTGAKVRIISGESDAICVEDGVTCNGKPNLGTHGDGNAVYVTLYAGDRVTDFDASNLDEATLCATISKSAQFIGLVPENPEAALMEGSRVFKGPFKDLDLYDSSQPDHDTLVQYALEFEAAARAQPNVKAVRGATISKSNVHSLVMATNGLDYSRSSTSYSAYAEVIAADANDNMQSDGDYSSTRHFANLPPAKELGESAGQRAAAKLNDTRPDKDSMPVVLSHTAAETFFGSLYAAMSAGAVYRDVTAFKDKIGQQVTDAGVTLVDDPTTPGGMSSAHIDGHGLEAKPITFIKDGILQSYMTSLTASRQLGIEPSGRDGLSRSGITNAIILPGTLTPEQLIADIDDGIYVEEFVGGIADIKENGDFSRQAFGKRIRNGQITSEALDGFAVAGKLQKMFMEAKIANDTPAMTDTKHSLRVATTRLPVMNISSIQ